jgi:hypothetical protein
MFVATLAMPGGHIFVCFVGIDWVEKWLRSITRSIELTDSAQACSAIYMERAKCDSLYGSSYCNCAIILI